MVHNNLLHWWNIEYSNILDYVSVLTSTSFYFNLTIAAGPQQSPQSSVKSSDNVTTQKLIKALVNAYTKISPIILFIYEIVKMFCTQLFQVHFFLF